MSAEVIGGIAGRIDRSCRLVAADPILAAMQQQAGGDERGPLAIAQLTRAAHLAFRRNAPVTRSILMGDATANYVARACVTPDRDGADILLVDLVQKDMTDLPQSTAVEASVDGWLWEADSRLRLVQLRALGQSFAFERNRWAGLSLSRVFLLIPQDDGRFPLLDAIAEMVAFADQPADITTDSGPVRVTLQGQPQVDGVGRFIGFRGSAHRVRSDAAAAPATPASGMITALGSPALSRRIDGALRGPLNRIVATAETIAQQLDGPIRADYARYASNIAEAARHLLGLVDDMSDLHAIERPDFTAAKEPVDMHDMLRRTAGLLSVKADERDIAVTIQPGERVVAIGEFRRILQIMLNLLGNAIAYTPEGGRVLLTAARHNGVIAVHVTDTGPGIPEADRERIFNKFERLGRNDGVGSGLGLYIARHLARAMGGSLVVSPVEGPGSVFTLTLPAAPPTPLG